MATSFEDVARLIETGGRLTDEDIRTLSAERDIIALGILADSVRRKLHGTTTTFVRVFDVSFSDGPHAPALQAAGVPAGAGEVRLLQAPPTLDAAVSIVTDARDLAGKIPLSAFSLSDLNGLAEGLPVVLTALKDAGLELIAHAPLDRLPSPERQLEAIADAGLELARLTISETPAREWSAICREVSAHQRRLRSIRAFAPLPRAIDATQPTTGYGDVKRVALARILAQNVDSIQVDWQLYGPKLAQVALTFGADDIDSVSPIDDESTGHRRSAIEEIRRSIESASLTPVERDARFKPL